MSFQGRKKNEINISGHIWFTAIVILSITAIVVLQQPLLLAGLFLAGVILLVLGATELKLKDWQILALLFFIIIVLPPLSSKGSLRVLRPEVFFFLTLFPYLILTRPAIHKADKLFRIFLYSLAVFAVYILFSIIFARVYLDTPVSGSDFLEIFKYLMFIVILLGVFKLELTEQNINRLLYAIVGFFLIAAILAMFMFYGVLGTDYTLGPLYFYNRLHDVHERLMGTFFNPNTFGTALSIAAVVALGLFFHAKKTGRKVLMLLIIGILTYSVFLTQSRTAFITLALAYLTFGVIHTFSGNFSFKQMAVTIASFAVIIALTLSILSDAFIDRILSVGDITDDLSWQMRMAAWYFNLYVFTDSMIFGLGPAKAVYTGIVDNEYILILRRYGLVGFFIHCFIYLIPMIRSILFFNKRGVTLLIAQIVFVSSVVLLVSNITSQPFHEIQLMSYWFIFLGIFFILPLSNDPQEKIEQNSN